MSGHQSSDEVSALTAQNNIVLFKFLWDWSYHFVIPTSSDSFADPDVSQVGDVSIDNWSSIQIITELWMEMGDIGL